MEFQKDIYPSDACKDMQTGVCWAILKFCCPITSTIVCWARSPFQTNQKSIPKLALGIQFRTSRLPGTIFRPFQRLKNALLSCSEKAMSSYKCFQLAQTGYYRDHYSLAPLLSPVSLSVDQRLAARNNREGALSLSTECCHRYFFSTSQQRTGTQKQRRIVMKS